MKTMKIWMFLKDYHIYCTYIVTDMTYQINLQIKSKVSVGSQAVIISKGQDPPNWKVINLLSHWLFNYWLWMRCKK